MKMVGFGSPKLDQYIRMRIVPLFKLPVLLVLVFSGGLIGATVARGQPTVSVQAGASFATWGGDDAKEQEEIGLDIDYRTGVAIQASAVLPLTDLLGLQIGAAYVQKGMFSQMRADNFYFESAAEMGYIESPVLLKISPQLEGPLSPYVTAGPAFSFALYCGTNSSIMVSLPDLVTGESVTVDRSESEECEEDEFNTFDIGATAGAGLAFAVSPSWSLTLDFMYNHGLTSIAKTDDDLVEQPEDTKNRTFAIMVGVAFPIR